MKIHEECGVFGCYVFDGNASKYITHGLFMLQHRGQESAGICCGEKELTILKDKGLVTEVLKKEALEHLSGSFGIGHVRYSTQGNSNSLHAQPYLIKYMGEDVAIAHNGNVSRAIKMREKYEKMGEVFLTSSDTEFMLKRVVLGMRKKPSEWGCDEIAKTLNKSFSHGAWSIVFALPGRVLGFRDPSGYRPLMLCEAKEGYFLASEDCAFNMLDVLNIIEIQPGECVEITSSGYKISSFAKVKPSSEQKCVFEHIYFAKPISNIFGRNVYLSRVELGKKLAIESKVKADVVIPVMDSGLPSAIGFSQQSGIPLHIGLLRNHWVGRTFIQPDQNERRQKVRQKLTPIRQIIEGKSVVLVDDSIVRGTTSREIIAMLKKAGAKEIHFRLASPMLVNTCFWGVDIPTKEELVATSLGSEEKIAQYLGADSVKYLSFDGLQKIFGKEGWCYNCFINNKRSSND